MSYWEREVMLRRPRMKLRQKKIALIINLAMHNQQQQATDREGKSVDKDPLIAKAQELLKGETGVQTDMKRKPTTEGI